MGRLLLGALLAGVLVGCSGKSEEDSDDSGVTGTTSPDTAACSVRGDPGLAMMPGNSPDSTAPAIQQLDIPYTIELAPDAGGWVRIVFPAPGTYTLHTGFAEVFRGLWADDGERVLEEPRPSEVCADEVPEVFTITVGEPVTYYMQLGPLTSRLFWVYVQQEA